MAINKVSYVFDPFDLVGVAKPKRRNIAAARREIADYVLDEVLNYVGDGKSPVKNGTWKRSLTPEYKKRKAELSSELFANMELTGEMLDSLEVTVRRDGKLELKIEGDQAPKADGHNNHSGRSPLPAREFIPKKGQTFKRQITSGIREIAREAIDGED